MTHSTTINPRYSNTNLGEPISITTETTRFYSIKEDQIHVDVPAMVAAKLSLFVAVTCYGGIVAETSMAITRLERFMRPTKIPVNVHYHIKNSIPSLARNMCVAEFMASTYTHLLFIDRDVVFNESDPLRMLSANLPVLGGNYTRKHLFSELLCDFIDGKDIKELRALSNDIFNHCTQFLGHSLPDGDRLDFAHEAETLPGGFLLIRRDTLEQMIAAHQDKRIELGLDSDNGKRIQPFLFDLFSYGFDATGFHGEDVGFCRRCRTLGIKIYVDTLARLGHVGEWEYRGDPATA